ncbi:MAG: SCO family protein [Herminiimonas sp.]|nr:SCO family protein [Herminiimonas sp.]
MIEISAPSSGVPGYRYTRAQPARCIALASVLALASILGACRDVPAQRSALADVSGHLPDLAFRFTNDRGEKVTAADYSGAVSLLYFGFTRCPDECPDAMARAAAAVLKSGAGPGELHTFLATVDPDHDTPAVLHAYLTPFADAHPIGLSGDADATLALVKRYRVAYQSADGVHRLPVHGAAIYVFDRAGHARRMIGAADSIDAIVQDLTVLLAEPRP